MQTSLFNAMAFGAAFAAFDCAAVAAAGCTPTVMREETHVAAAGASNMGDHVPQCLPVGDYKICDDGDGVYSTANGSKDHWEAKGGVKLYMEAPDLKAFLSSIGLDSRSLDHVKVNGLGEYVAELNAGLSEMKGTKDEATILARWNKIHAAGTAANIVFRYESSLFERIISAVGPMACYIPLQMGVEDSDAADSAGRIESMRSWLKGAGSCAKSQRLDDRKFDGRIAAAKVAGYKKALEGMAKSDTARNGDVEAVRNQLMKLAESANVDGVDAQLRADFMKIMFAAYKNAIKNIIDSSAAVGDLAQLRARLSRLEEIARSDSIYSELKDDFAKARAALKVKK